MLSVKCVTEEKGTADLNKKEYRLETSVPKKSVQSDEEEERKFSSVDPRVSSARCVTETCGKQSTKFPVRSSFTGIKVIPERGITYL